MKYSKERRVHLTMNKKRRVHLMMNKRGQIGKIISTIPVMFAIIFLMGIFLFVTSQISGEDAKKTTLGVGGQSDKLLTKEFKEGGVPKGITFFDAFVFSKASYSKIKDALIADMGEKIAAGKYDTVCVILLKDSNPNPISDYDSITGILSDSHGFFARFANDKHGFLKLNARANAKYFTESLTNYAFDSADDKGKIITTYVQVYYGECLGGAV